MALRQGGRGVNSPIVGAPSSTGFNPLRRTFKSSAGRQLPPGDFQTLNLGVNSRRDDFQSQNLGVDARRRQEILVFLGVYSRQKEKILAFPGVHPRDDGKILLAGGVETRISEFAEGWEGVDSRAASLRCE
jgi:hypothetical protein